MAKSAWGPQENSNHSEDNSNIRCSFLNGYCTPGWGGQCLLRPSQPTCQGAIMGPFYRQGNRDPEKDCLPKVTLQGSGKASIPSPACQ